MELRTVDPADDGAFSAWFAVVAAAEADSWPGEVRWQPDELRAKLARPDTVRHIGLAAYDAATAVGAAWMECPLVDNPHMATAMVEVLPGRRRRGVGRFLVDHLESQAAAQGRSVLAAHHEEPLRLDGRSPGRAFATACGYQPAIVGFRRDLAVPLPPARRAALESGAAPDRYEVTAWRGPWPDEYLADRCELGRRMSTDAPVGDWELSEEHWDEARVRCEEAATAAMGRELLTAAARDRDADRLVAFTALAVARRGARRALQQDTLVLAEHRGHGLGMRVKLANLALLAEASPGTRSVTTFNAANNHYMGDVNDALGAEVVANVITWQRRLGP